MHLHEATLVMRQQTPIPLKRLRDISVPRSLALLPLLFAEQNMLCRLFVYSHQAAALSRVVFCTVGDVIIELVS